MKIMHDYNLIVCLFICVTLCVIIMSVVCEYFIHYFACKMCIAMYTTRLINLILYLFYFQILLCGILLVRHISTVLYFFYYVSIFQIISYLTT